MISLFLLLKFVIMRKMRLLRKEKRGSKIRLILLGCVVLCYRRNKRRKMTVRARKQCQMAYKQLIRDVKLREVVSVTREKAENCLMVNTACGRGGASAAAYHMLLEPMNQDRQLCCNMLVGVNASVERKSLEHVCVLEDEGVDQKEFISLGDTWGYLDLFRSPNRIVDHSLFQNADIVHLHNLHGGYFSPFELPRLTSDKPTVWTLHDMQSITGHCAHAYDCQAWKTGCQCCPRLDSYVSLARDTSAMLFEIKRKIYAACAQDMVVVTPCDWLKSMLEESMLKGKDIRRIYNGIDENVFYPGDQKKIRQKLNLPLHHKIILFIADHGEENPYKGSRYIRLCYEALQERSDILFIAIGGKENEELAHNYVRRAYVSSMQELREYYVAADVFLYPSLADTFPFVTLESMSCGTPVVSFATGGIVEQILHMETGYLAKYCDFQDLLNGLELFLSDEGLLHNAKVKSRARVATHFTQAQCVASYVALYNELFEKRKFIDPLN